VKMQLELKLTTLLVSTSSGGARASGTRVPTRCLEGASMDKIHFLGCICGEKKLILQRNAFLGGVLCTPLGTFRSAVEYKKQGE
jgi:hypothetical protein